jgi:hypothetical protein
MRDIVILVKIHAIGIDEQCKKPFCSANGTCPEDLKHYVKDSSGKPIIPPPQQTTQVSTKGECK